MEHPDQPRPASLDRPFRTDIYYGASLAKAASTGLCLVFATLLNATLP